MHHPFHRRAAAATTAGLVALALLTGCSTASPSSSTGTSSGSAPTTTSGATTASAVLPVASDPIVDTSTTPGLAVTQVLLEDNTDASGAAISDCLQVTISNTSSQEATGLEMFYTMTDATTGASESYYQALDGLSIPAGGSATVWFDGGSGTGHYAENAYSIYRSSTNEIDFTVEVAASGLQIATGTGIKSPGGAEQAD
ncbi:hypothetical protein [Demequina capsici]|uniref:DUF4352 domain-containing protein n=1 Tax=Demequina capsici TaxID=3075620 RepID=A0AA96J669_9MICO|nr:hypothetical protein [Demequina sp. OYTSA14]WNM23907.1 hypothetical protein RN606_11140 [Demequina sp. OYTSA14]